VSRPDDEQRFRDDLAEQLRERDRQREPRPHRHPRCIAPSLIKRHEVQIAAGTDSVRLDCPKCRGPVFVPADSQLEVIDCAACATSLMTRRTIEGVTVVELDKGIADTTVDVEGALTKIGDEHEPPARVAAARVRRDRPEREVVTAPKHPTEPIAEGILRFAESLCADRPTLVEALLKAVALLAAESRDPATVLRIATEALTDCMAMAQHIKTAERPS
jgi:hypothetical protein